MNSRERIRAALAHQEPDVVPIDFNGHRSSGIMAQTYVKLRELLGDLTEDNRVGVADLAIMQAHLGQTTGARRADGDLTGEGTVNRADVVEMLRNLGRWYDPPVSAPADLKKGIPAASPSSPEAMQIVVFDPGDESAGTSPGAPWAGRNLRSRPATRLAKAAVDRAIAEIWDVAAIRRRVLRAARQPMSGGNGGSLKCTGRRAASSTQRATASGNESLYGNGPGVLDVIDNL
ncbi:MAG: hypothetical protein HQ567_14860 [Candidatus Nealsonbacteria bacterium]|nr:hypothetical protein [Candidatus Nealsonbacteria bacterium]